MPKQGQHATHPAVEPYHAKQTETGSTNLDAKHFCELPEIAS